MDASLKRKSLIFPPIILGAAERLRHVRIIKAKETATACVPAIYAIVDDLGLSTLAREARNMAAAGQASQ